LENGKNAKTPRLQFEPEDGSSALQIGLIREIRENKGKGNRNVPGKEFRKFPYPEGKLFSSPPPILLLAQSTKINLSYHRPQP
jgi:hypothetical protein